MRTRFATASHPIHRTPVRMQVLRSARRIVASAQSENGAHQEAKAAGISFGHILLALADSNPHLSTASRSALETAAALAKANESRLTVMFMDEEGKKSDSRRMQLVQGELQSRGLHEPRVKFVEEEVEATVGKGSVAVGEVADSVEADLLVLAAEAIHEKHVDGNLIAEFVSCPVLLLP